MDKYSNQRIKIVDLLLDVENPRHNLLSDQSEVFDALLNNQGDKLIRLAKDIIKEGINPTELPIIVNYPGNADKFIVAEGNRRILVLKILQNPELISSIGKASLKRRFEELSKEFLKNPINEIDCIVFEQKDEAYHWIELRHTGESKGVGIVGWDAASVARFKKGQSWMALQVVDYVKANAKLDEHVKSKLQYHLTNLARLVNDPDVRDSLGIQAENGTLKSKIGSPELLKGLCKVVTDVATGVISVNHIRTKPQRQEYIEGLVKDKYISTSSNPSIAPWELPLPGTVHIEPKGRRPITERKILIPTKCVLRISHNRLNKIYRELKLLEVDPFTNCAAVMLRVFLELSIDDYIKTKHISIPKDAKLSKKLQLVAEYMEKNNLLDKNKLKPVRVAASSRDALFSTDTMHAYVHNKDFSPKPNDLIITWDNMQAFMEVIWS
jgi:hypothetical protein